MDATEILDATDIHERLHTGREIVARRETCLGPARWRDGVLQQLWRVEQLNTEGGVEIVMDFWRDVPQAPT